MPKILLVSDLHLEFSDIDIVNDANYDVLILSGDIMVVQDLSDHSAESVRAAAVIDSLGSRQKTAQRFREFLRRVSQQFPNVVYVAGNHEFYHGKWHKSLATLKAECAVYSNIHFLEMSSFDIMGVTFLGGTLWTDMNKCEPVTMQAITNMMNDFKLIKNDNASFRKLSSQDVVIRHRKTLDYFKQAIESNPTGKFVVVGHHLPTFMSVHPQYKNDFTMNGGYASDLSDFILDHPQIVLWTCGHTHFPHRYYMGSTLVACNPRGYTGDNFNENAAWRANRSIDLAAMPAFNVVAEDWHWDKE